MLGPVEPAYRVAGGRFQFADDERNPVDEQHEVEADLNPRGLEGQLLRDEVSVVVQVVEVDEAHGHMLVILAEGHTFVAAQPLGEGFVGAHQPIAVHREQNGVEPVQHLVGVVGPGGDVGIEAQQGVGEFVHEQHVPDGAVEFFGWLEKPVEPVREHIADKVFDAV